MSKTMNCYSCGGDGFLESYDEDHGKIFNSCLTCKDSGVVTTSKKSKFKYAKLLRKYKNSSLSSNKLDYKPAVTISNNKENILF